MMRPCRSQPVCSASCYSSVGCPRLPVARVKDKLRSSCVYPSLVPQKQEVTYRTLGLSVDILYHLGSLSIGGVRSFPGELVGTRRVWTREGNHVEALRRGRLAGRDTDTTLETQRAGTIDFENSPSGRHDHLNFTSEQPRAKNYCYSSYTDYVKASL